MKNFIWQNNWDMSAKQEGAFFAMQGLSEQVVMELKVRSWTRFYYAYLIAAIALKNYKLPIF